MRQPMSCSGCPLHHPDKQYVPDYIPANRKLTIYYDSPDTRFAGEIADETQEAVYFRREMLPVMQGVQYDGVGFAHLLRCKIPANKPLKGKELKDAIAHCRQYDDIDNASVLIVPGFLAWQYFSQRAGSRKDYSGFFVEVDYDREVEVEVEISGDE